MTGSPPIRLLVQPFPAPGPLVQLAYRELDRAAAGSPEQIRALGDARLLPPPWEPASCRTSQLREQLWLWLDAVVECWSPSTSRSRRRHSSVLAAVSTPGERDRGAG